MGIYILIAVAISFGVGLILCPIAIPILHKLKFGQYIREEGPASHQKKSGTPTMGGIVIIIAFVLGSVFFIGNYPSVKYVVIFTCCFGIIGLLDDSLKLAKHQSEGLKSWQKFSLQIIVTALLLLYIALGTEEGTYLIIPFLGYFDMHGWFYPIAAIAILGTVNGANFTDGLDGLAATVTSVIAVFFTGAGIVLKAGITPSTCAMIGALFAFLFFNCYPAKVFMGDTGSLALGGFVAVVAMILKMPVFLIIVAFVYLAEIASVIIQVGYFKISHGKRIFKMSPIHHHFELCGWSETKVVTIFTIVTILLSAIAYAGLIAAFN